MLGTMIGARSGNAKRIAEADVVSGKGQTMSRYIDADALKANCDITVGNTIIGRRDYVMFHEIDSAPSIDIVRCKECRHSFINENHSQKPRICGLTKKCGTTKDDWYCADGERKGE